MHFRPGHQVYVEIFEDSYANTIRDQRQASFTSHTFKSLQVQVGIGGRLLSRFKVK